MSSARSLALVALSTAFVAAPAFPGNDVDLPIRTEFIVGGLGLPTFVTFPPGDDSRMFIVQKAGRIRIFDFNTNSLLETDFLNIDPLVEGGTTLNGEQGLLGMAFHPDYANNGYFYVYYTATGSGANTTRRFKVSDDDPNVADPNSGTPVIAWADPFSNHNGGWIAFGPDGYLYIASGDGGSANDPGNRAQDITDQKLGKILRIDVNGDDFPEDNTRNYAIPPDNPFVDKVGDDEILHYGLRNPWRCSIDRQTGDLWIGDVGQNAWEEISFAAFGDFGLNFGWRCKEGFACTGLSGCSCTDPSLTDPLAVFGHNAAGGFAVIGGYVYRGCEIPEADGVYFYSDFATANFWSLRYDGETVTDLVSQNSNFKPAIGGQIVNQISAFGENNQGELFVIDHGGPTTGQIFRVIRDPEAEPLPDCNENGVPDTCDIAKGNSKDANNNGVPDECEEPKCAPADFDCNGVIDGADLGAMLAAWGDCPKKGECPADLDGNGVVDGADLGELLAGWSKVG